MLAQAPLAGDSAPIVLVRADAASAADWDAYVNSNSRASAYHLYKWRHVISASFGAECHYLMVRIQESDGVQPGAVCGVLPLVRLKSALFGDYLVSLPFFNYGGVLADNSQLERFLFDGAVVLAQQLGVSHVELRHEGDMFPALPQRTDKVAMLLSLPGSADVLWKNLPAKVRAQVRRPERDGAVIRSGGKELVADFYRVFAENMRDLGTPVYAREFFSCVLDSFAESTRLFVVYLDDAPVAAGFVLGFGAVLQIPWASSLRRANSIGVNMLLYWKILQFACESGYDTFDFGRCSLDGGTFRFKKQWGAEPRQLHWHYWMRDGGPPAVMNHSNPKYRLAIAVWQKLPLAIANRVGPLLARRLP
jgi:FemAB-related protein (PEP-CTERM system-associated)